MMILIFFLLLSVVVAENRIVVHYKDEKLARAVVSALRLDGILSAKTSSVDRNAVIWELSPDLTSIQTRLIMEIFRLDPSVETVEEEMLVYPLV